MSEMESQNSWLEAKLGDLGSFSTSGVDKKIAAGERPVRLINYMDVYRRNVIDASIDFMEVTASTAAIAKSSVQYGDVLFTPSSETPDDIGHSAVVVEELPDHLHSYHTVRFRLFDQECLDVGFRAWFANTDSVRKQFEQKCAGSTRYTLPLPAFRSVVVTFPISRKTQAKIARILQAVDRAIEKTEALIDKYQQIKAGLMHDLFTRGIGPDGQLRPPRELAPELYQETPIGWIPKEWSVKRLADACDWFSGGTPSKAREDWWLGDLPWLSPKDMKKFELSDTEHHVTKKAAVSGSRVVPEETVFIVVRGMILAHSFPVVISRNEFSFNQDIKALRGRGALDNRYLAYWFVANKNLFLKKTTESTHGTKRLDLHDLYAIQIVIPSVAEQEGIVRRIDVAESMIESTLLQRDKLQLQKSGLMHDLLTGKVPVHVEPEEEPEAAHV